MSEYSLPKCEICLSESALKYDPDQGLRLCENCFWNEKYWTDDVSMEHEDDVVNQVNEAEKKIDAVGAKALMDGLENRAQWAETEVAMAKPQEMVDLRVRSLSTKAIPTKYGDVLFRSRLEAKWARFFDLCNWPWSYEPVDLAGWIPDFALGWEPTMVEVKPYFHAEQFREVEEKIIESGYEGDVIFLGADPCIIPQELGIPVLGWISQVFPDGQRGTNDLHFGHTEGNGLLGLCPLDQAWVNVIWKAPPYSEQCTHPNKWARVWNDDGDCDKPNKIYAGGASEALKRCWRAASNSVQWRKK